MEPAVRGTARQRFEAADRSRPWVHDRLKERRNPPLANELHELVCRSIQSAQAQRRGVWTQIGHVDRAQAVGMIAYVNDPKWTRSEMCFADLRQFLRPT